MVLDAIIEKESLSIEITDPFKADIEAITKKIENFAASKKTDVAGCDIRGLIPKMIRGIAGCESGCPANAKSLVENGFANFELKYIEGGILAAKASIEGGKTLQLKMFPDF
ncbi:MAG: hypothetical protein HQL10_10330 [Nitrospirae bacterium]|nr:hypothetical protein [Nitrospirota bacterium]